MMQINVPQPNVKQPCVYSLAHFISIQRIWSRNAWMHAILIHCFLIGIYGFSVQHETYIVKPIVIFHSVFYEKFPGELSFIVPSISPKIPMITVTLSQDSVELPIVKIYSNDSTNTTYEHLDFPCYYRVTSVSVDQLGPRQAVSGHLSLCKNGASGLVSLPVSSTFPHGAELYIEPASSTKPENDGLDLKRELEQPHRITLALLNPHGSSNHISGSPSAYANTSFRLLEEEATSLDVTETVNSTDRPMRFRRSVRRMADATQSANDLVPTPLRIVHDPNKPEHFTLELYLIADETLVKAFNFKYERLVYYVNQLIAKVNAIYAQFSIRIVVVRFEIWASNRINLYGMGLSPLRVLAQFKRTETRVRHDCLHALLHDVSSYSLPKGKAEQRSMCVSSKCVGYTRMVVKPGRFDFDVDLMDAARTMAHELGHNFGLEHDNENCVCQTCIMATGEEFSHTTVTWSPCSLTNLPSYLAFGMGLCLHDAPCSSTTTIFNKLSNEQNSRNQLGPIALSKPKSNASTRSCQPKAVEPEPTSYANIFCGNGILDPGEECDCGTSVSCPPSLQQCCDVQHCKLRSGSTCAGGPCCEPHVIGHDSNGSAQYRCKLARSGTVCRSESGSCDLPEYCDGYSPWCPPDLYKSDGTSCQTEEGYQAYCVRGGCRESNSWCQALWGPTSRRAHRSCFDQNYLRTAPDVDARIANCGKQRPPLNLRFDEPDKWSGIPCSSMEDAECGRLWCTVHTERARLLGYITSATVKIGPNYPSCVALVYDPTWPASDSDTWDSNGLRQTNFDVAGHSFLSAVTQDAGMVPDGTPCSRGMCYNGSCVYADSIPSRVTCDCIGPGYCNNLGQCHCAPGFHPPHCKSGGAGGSLSSGPPPRGHRLDPGLVVALSIVLLIVLPLIVFFIYCGVYHRCRWNFLIVDPIVLTKSGLLRSLDFGFLRSCRSCLRRKNSLANQPTVNGYHTNGTTREPIQMFHEDKHEYRAYPPSVQVVTPARTVRSPVIVLPLLASTDTSHRIRPSKPNRSQATLSPSRTPSEGPGEAPGSMFFGLSRRMGSIRSFWKLTRKESQRPLCSPVNNTTEPPTNLIISKPLLKSTTFTGPTLPVTEAKRILSPLIPFDSRPGYT